MVIVAVDFTRPAPFIHYTLRALTRLVPRPVKEVAKLLFYPQGRDPRHEEKVRLQKLPRYERSTSTLMGAPLEILDAESFLQMHHEIVEEAIYYFEAKDGCPYIIDGGANIGVSVLYFKSVYPQARVVAFEPDEEAFAVLQKNVESRGYRDVKLVRSALAASETNAGFMSEGSYAGRIARGDDQSTTNVPTTRLRPYLESHVDLLKINIEGAETEVLIDCADLLRNVDRIVLEYHSFAHETQTLHTLTGVLIDAGYRVHVRSVNNNWPVQPFVNIPVHLGMDLQLYIYAFRS